ncbi:hypothetical protein DY000_02009941 [Brassica cretica]|uniref:Uncharacterized protein n=1 Tax=Brassica cretica TaxID=69181 RepID=A0ABQ7C287_BRACR|nr:hypothetical protein DY000_02009941 [Brassica cretica]
MIYSHSYAQAIFDQSCCIFLDISQTTTRISKHFFQETRKAITNKDESREKEEITGEDECGCGAEETEEGSCFVAAERRHVRSFYLGSEIESMIEIWREGET